MTSGLSSPANVVVVLAMVRCHIIEILQGRTHSSCHNSNVDKGYWSADRKCGGSHALLECSALHALHLEFGG